MSWRTVVEINHDYLHDLLSHPDDVAVFLQALKQTLVEAQNVAPHGIRVLGQRHHADTLKLTVR
jgi:hypothetical protein